MPTSTRSPAGASRPILSARGIEGGYGRNQVLFGVDLDVASREIVAVIGHNGAGKSTLLRCLVGLLQPWRGQVMIDNERVRDLSPRFLARQGVNLVPQGGGVFEDLTVRENLTVSVSAIASRSQSEVLVGTSLEAFPALEPLLDQCAGTLSGGERQMLSVAMGFVRCPTFLLLDEPSMGLSPSLSESVMSSLKALRDAHGVGMLVVEQKVRQVVEAADRVYILRNGRVAHSGPAAELRDEEALIAAYL